MGKWTPKGNPQDGYYYKGKCKQCGEVEVVWNGTYAVCATFNSDENCEAVVIETPEGN